MYVSRVQYFQSSILCMVPGRNQSLFLLYQISIRNTITWLNHCFSPLHCSGLCHKRCSSLSRLLGQIKWCSDSGLTSRQVLRGPETNDESPSALSFRCSSHPRQGSRHWEQRYVIATKSCPCFVELLSFAAVYCRQLGHPIVIFFKMILPILGSSGSIINFRTGLSIFTKKVAGILMRSAWTLQICWKELTASDS